MIARLMISLKKASLSTGSTYWDLATSAPQRSDLPLRFDRPVLNTPQEELIPDGNIPLSPFTKPNENGEA